ncbi:hypothetical protein [Archangium sp.]|uniref:hypothetical protein n=1 Tax=Archangium sp. TaxID=1872627 RepID=UPI003899B741
MNRYTPPRPKPQLIVRGKALVEINGKERPAIIVRIFKDEERALVVCGTGTPRTEYVAIEVRENSAAGKALRLDKPTWFYATALRSVKLSHLKAIEGICLPELFLQVRLLVEGALAALPSGELTKDLSSDAVPTTKTQDNTTS